MIYMNIARELGRRLRHANEVVFETKIRYESVPDTFTFTI